MGRFRFIVSIVCVICFGLFAISSAIHLTVGAPDPVAELLVTKTRIIVVLGPLAIISDGLIGSLVNLVGGTLIHTYSSALSGLAISLPDPLGYDAAILALLANPFVSCVIPDTQAIIHSHVAETQPLQIGELAPTGVRRIQAATAEYTGSVDPTATTSIAVLDTGIDLTHPDIASARPGINCVTPGSSPQDDNGHGSAVAGVIAADNYGQGVVGVAPSTTLFAVKVADKNGYAWNSDVICGIEWTQKNSRKYNITVAQMSIGFPGNAQTPCNIDPLHLAVSSLTRSNVLMVTSVGNNHQSIGTTIPAAYPEVFAVTAMSDFDGKAGSLAPATASASCSTGELDDRIATYSNYATSQSNNIIAAPGTCIFSTYLLSTGGYAVVSGTSFAAPHVSGVVALCITDGLCAGKTPAQIKAIITNAANTNPQLSGYGYTITNTAEYYGPLVWAGAF